jgi:hypothetical protein
MLTYGKVDLESGRERTVTFNGLLRKASRVGPPRLPPAPAMIMFLIGVAMLNVYTDGALDDVFNVQL